MAIQHRGGNFADFDPFKMLPREFAYSLDTEELYYCVAPGNVKRCATKEDIVQILDTNQEAYDGLQQLISELEDETVLTGILADIATNAQDIINLDTKTMSHLAEKANKAKIATEFEFIAHRGLARVYPESTIPAFKNTSYYKQAHSLEFDIRSSLDDELFIFHDKTLNRTTNGTGNIADTLGADIRNLDAGSKFSPVYAGAKVPYLFELCSVLRGLDFEHIYPQTNVREISDPIKKRAILTTTINTFITYGLLEKTILQCIGIPTADLIRSINKDVTIAIMDSESVDHFNAALAWASKDKNCIIGFSSSFFLANPNIARTARSANVDVFTWTVNDTATVDKLRKANVFRIMTDVNLMGVK